MDKTQPKDWSKEWLDCVDPQKVTRYPLQLANCDRLEKNNAVYIFDEVGAGKTIMAGLMALHYSYHCYQADGRKARILVITTNQLADRDGEPGPFKQMWLDKLPFYEHWAGHVKVINHDYRNIRKVNGREQWNLDQVGDNWDLVIIDEAHERSLNIDFILGYLKVQRTGGRRKGWQNSCKKGRFPYSYTN